MSTEERITANDNGARGITPWVNGMLTPKLLVWLWRTLVGVIRDAGFAAIIMGILLALPFLDEGDSIVAQMRNMTGIEGQDRLLLLSAVGSTAMMLANLVAAVAFISVVIRTVLAVWRFLRASGAVLRRDISPEGVSHGI